jgi:hypothetical protein
MTRIVMNTDSLQATAAQMRAVAGEYDALGAQLAGEALPAMPADTAEYVQAGFDQARTTLQQLATELDTEARTLDWRVSMALEEGGFSTALDPLSSVMQAQQQMTSVWTQQDPFDAALAGLAAAPVGIAGCCGGAAAVAGYAGFGGTAISAASGDGSIVQPGQQAPAPPPGMVWSTIGGDSIDPLSGGDVQIVQPGQQMPAPPPGMVWSTIGGDSIDPLSGGDVQIVQPGQQMPAPPAGMVWSTIGGDSVTNIDVAGDWGMSGSDITNFGTVGGAPTGNDLIAAAGNNPAALSIVSSVLRSQARDAAIWTAPDNVGILSVW